MECPPPDSAPTTSCPQRDATPLSRRTINSVAYAAVLFTLVALHATNRDSLWQIENAMLLVAAAICGGWTCRLRDAFALTFIAACGWWLIDLNREPDPFSCSWRHVIRIASVMTVIVLTTRARQLLRESERNARIDALTGLPNRRAILDALEAELCRLKRFNRSFSLAMIDCDGFKQINDQQGHLAGDQALRLIAAAFRKHLRAYDIVGRLGGDEFVLILPETTSSEVNRIIDRLRIALRTELGQYPTVTFSMGIVTIHTPPDPKLASPGVEACLRQADEAMYSAKRSGRDQTCYAVQDQANQPV